MKKVVSVYNPDVYSAADAVTPIVVSIDNSIVITNVTDKSFFSSKSSCSQTNFIFITSLTNMPYFVT